MAGRLKDHALVVFTRGRGICLFSHGYHPFAVFAFSVLCAATRQDSTCSEIFHRLPRVALGRRLVVTGRCLTGHMFVRDQSHSGRDWWFGHDDRNGRHFTPVPQKKQGSAQARRNMAEVINRISPAVP